MRIPCQLLKTVDGDSALVAAVKPMTASRLAYALAIFAMDPGVQQGCDLACKHEVRPEIPPVVAITSRTLPIEFDGSTSLAQAPAPAVR